VNRASLHRLIAVSTASVLAAAAVFWIAPRLRTTRVLETRWVEPSKPASGATPARPSGLRKRPLDEAELKELGFELSPQSQYDPLCFVRYRGNARYEFSFPEYPGGVIHGATNGHGLRGRDPVRTDRPELRMLVVGDSHTDGVCDPARAYPALVQERLIADGRDAEALNAGVAGYSFSQYVGALERYLPLAPDVVVLAVYGGNDFQESLRMHHWFAGETPPASTPDYRESVQRALDVSAAAVGQGGLSLRYFADHPDERDVALEAGRQTLTEFRDQCAAAGAKLLLVYIPPALDVAWESHARVLERVERELKLDASQRGTIDALADRFLESARELGVEWIDMRPTFRAQRESPYWSLDFHINLEGQRLVAEQVAAAVERVLPPGFPRTAPEPHPERLEPTEDAPQIGDGWKLRLDAAPIETTSYSEERAAQLFRWTDAQRFDEVAGFVDLDARAASPSADVLVLGDELVAGSQRFIELLAARGVECIDATTEGYGPLNYLGAYERHAARAKTVVVVWNGGNDFVEAFDELRSLSRAPDKASRPPPERLAPGDVATRWNSKAREARLAAEAGLRFTVELERRVREHGGDLIVVLVRPNAGRSRTERGEGLDVLDRVANAFSSALIDAGFEVLDGDEQQHAGGPPVVATGASTLTEVARVRLAESIAAAVRAR